MQGGECRLSDFLPSCEQAARAGGEVLLRWIGRFAVREKGPSDLVTEADTESQQAVRSLLLSRFPHHDIVGEEDESRGSRRAEYCWFIDPLDGTTNYVHQVPHYAVSVALARRGQVVAATVFDPVSRECYTAAHGEGAYLNGQKLRVSGVEQLSRALVAASFSSKVEPTSPEIDQFIAAILACQGVRRTGSAALNMCYVAAGRFDGFWAMSTKAWDVAAGVLLVQEAGGVVSDLRGEPLALAEPHPVAASTPLLHRQLRHLLQTADRKRSLGAPG